MKGQRTYTRRGRALKTLAILLAIILIGGVTGAYYVLPFQARDQLIQKEAVGEVDIITAMYDQDLEPTPLMRYYLCANDDVLMLCGTRFHFLMGWYHQFAAQTPLKGDSPIKACYQTFSREGQGQKIYVFGRIDDDDIDSVEVEARYYYELTKEIKPIIVSVGKDEFIHHDGHRYFLKEMNSLVRPEETYPGLDYHFNGIYVAGVDANGQRVEFTDKEGNTVTEARIENYHHTSFG